MHLTKKHTPQALPICNAVALIDSAIKLGSEEGESAKSANMMKFARTRLINNLVKKGQSDD